MRGGPSRKALAVIRKSGKAAAAPKVRWPLAFTNTESNACPQTLKEKGRKSSTKPSSPTGRGSPGRNALKTTFTPDTVPPAAADTGVKTLGSSGVPRLLESPVL